MAYRSAYDEQQPGPRRQGVINALAPTPITAPGIQPSRAGTYEQGGITGGTAGPGQMPYKPSNQSLMDLGDSYTGHIDPNNPAHVAAQKRALEIEASGADANYAGGLQGPSAAAPVAQKYKIQPVDQAKFDDPNHMTGKYQFLRAAQGFDPRQGATPEFLAKVNALGLGTFAGSGDKLSLTGVTDAGRKAGIDPRDFNGDFIQGFKGNDPQWAWDWKDDAAGAQPLARAGQAGGGTPAFGGSNISGMLQSDAQGNIQQALGALNQPGRLQQLIAALGGGQGQL